MFRLSIFFVSSHMRTSIIAVPLQRKAACPEETPDRRLFAGKIARNPACCGIYASLRPVTPLKNGIFDLQLRSDVRWAVDSGEGSDR